MKIAVWHNLPSGGGKRALYDHVRGLVARGHTVEAWCPPTADSSFLPLSSLIPEHVVDLNWPRNPGRTEVWHIERSLAAMDAHCRKCAEEMESRGFDILFANTCQFLAASPIGRFSKLPSVLYLQEPHRALYEASPRMWWLARPAKDSRLTNPANWRPSVGDWLRLRSLRVQGREEAQNAAAFSRILVNSYFSRDSVVRAYGLDSDVCYLGVDTTHFVDHGLAREDYVVGLGSISPHKNLKLVIEAVGAMPAPQPKLVWVGNFSGLDYRKAMEEVAHACGVVIELKVRIPDDEVIDVLNRAIVMVYASRLEPFGLAPIEANACGVPVVAVPEGGVRESIRHEVNGLLADPNPLDIAQAIARIRDNPSFARQLGKNARALVETEFSLDAAAARLENRLLQYAGRSHSNEQETDAETLTAAGF